MKKNGFTLVELLGILIILGLVLLVTVPVIKSVTKNSKQELYESQISSIEQGLKNWAVDNTKLLPINESETITLTLGQLRNGGYIDLEIKNPKTSKCFGNDMLLTVTRYQKNYLYKVIEGSGVETRNCDDALKPSIILNGNSTVFVEVNTPYTEMGAIATSITGNDITSSIVTTISGGGIIDTNTINNKYTITYSVTDGDETVSAIRTVIVKDTIAPILTIPGNENITTDELAFDLMNGVSATDNSGEVPVITTSSNISFGIPGTYNVTYTAKDSSGNVTKKVRSIVIFTDRTYKDLILNGADPVVKTGMIPVNIAADGTVTKADLNSEWYNYANKEWANVVTVTEESRANYMSATVGTTIEESDILTYLVWIPRYKYELWNVDVENPSKPTPHSIAITFENKDTAKSEGSTNGTYLTHPAFTFGEEELNGIWVGKFETGYKGAISPYDSFPNAINSSKVVIKPKTYAWTGIDVSNAFYSVKGMNAENNVFGLNITSDTHIMKNTEWGAVAYLSHSVYGKDGEVYINNDIGHETGCGANGASDVSTNGCLNAYGSKSDNVYNQSTTGNISGVFDMSGGAYEFVMGYTTGASTEYGYSGFTTSTFPASKYVDTYSSTSDTQYTNRILGDATGEMGAFSGLKGSWYQDSAHFIRKDFPWFSRGGYYDDNTSAGVFNFFLDYGGDTHYSAFRITIA